jgi:SAM-dependent methyltransferase
MSIGIFKRRSYFEARPAARGPTVLNVGGNSKAIPIPKHYDAWTHLLLDIDPAGRPDVVCDARKLDTLDAGSFDAVYCSHNLEHYYKHDVGKVLRGFLHVLKDDGFAEIRVPDLRSVMRRCVAEGLDVEDVLYQSAAGPITVGDVFYGFAKQIETSGVDFYAHKTGFTARSLTAVLQQAGFAKVFVAERTEAYELAGLAFKKEPAPWQVELLGLQAAA